MQSVAHQKKSAGVDEFGRKMLHAIPHCVPFRRLFSGVLIIIMIGIVIAIVI